MTHTPNLPSDSAQTPEIKGLMPGFNLYPGESETDYEAFKDGLLSDLNPGAPYEHLIADQIVSLAWEAYRHRRLRDSLVSMAYRAQVVQMLETVLPDIEKDHEEYKDVDPERLACDIISDNKDKRASAERIFEFVTIQPHQLVAEAYRFAETSIAPHERHIADTEKRLRLLRDDFDRLKASRAKPVDEAELLSW